MATKDEWRRTDSWDWEVIQPRTRCKHGWYSCVICGTSDRTDAFHTTRGGRGVVGQAVARDKANRRSGSASR